MHRRVGEPDQAIRRVEVTARGFVIFRIFVRPAAAAPPRQTAPRILALIEIKTGHIGEGES
jgi:hypothetical protein